MSKSLGNLLMIDDLLKENSADAIRYYLANHHYRQAWEHDAAALARATTTVGELEAAATVESGPREPALDPAPAINPFVHCMDDDLDSVMALNQLRQFAINIQEAAAFRAQRAGGSSRTEQDDGCLWSASRPH